MFGMMIPDDLAVTTCDRELVRLAGVLLIPSMRSEIALAVELAKPQQSFVTGRNPDRFPQNLIYHDQIGHLPL